MVDDTMLTRHAPPKLDELIESLSRDQHSLHVTLERFVRHNTAILDATVFEVDTTPPPAAAGAATSNSFFRAQTNDVEVIKGLLVITPEGTTSATLTVGALVIPVQGTTFLLSPLEWVIKDHNRSLAYTAPANAAIGSTVVLWGYAAPANMPGVLH